VPCGTGQSCLPHEHLQRTSFFLRTHSALLYGCSESRSPTVGHTGYFCSFTKTSNAGIPHPFAQGCVEDAQASRSYARRGWFQRGPLAQDRPKFLGRASRSPELTSRHWRGGTSGLSCWSFCLRPQLCKPDEQWRWVCRAVGPCRRPGMQGRPPLQSQEMVHLWLLPQSWESE
jgi:hypothetical protein